MQKLVAKGRLPLIAERSGIHVAIPAKVFKGGVFPLQRKLLPLSFTAGRLAGLRLPPLNARSRSI